MGFSGLEHPELLYICFRLSAYRVEFNDMEKIVEDDRVLIKYILESMGGSVDFSYYGSAGLLIRLLVLLYLLPVGYVLNTVQHSAVSFPRIHQVHVKWFADGGLGTYVSK